MKRFIKSFSFALRGVRFAIRTERNFQVEVAIALLLIPFVVLLDLHTWERVAIIFLIGWVMCAELANTVMERITDMLKPKIHPYARVVKDLMAAVVLISSIVALLIAVMIFFPYFKDLFFP